MFTIPKFNKNLSCRWQTARRLCTPMLRSPWYKTLRSPAFHPVLPRAAFWRMTAVYWPDFPIFTYPSRIWRPQWGESLRTIEFIFGMGKLEWLGYNLVKVARWSTQSLWHNTSTWQTQRQPRRLTRCHANVLASGGQRSRDVGYSPFWTK